MLNLSGKTVLITGAAGRIGSAIATKIIEDGGTVLLTDINKAKLIKNPLSLIAKKLKRLLIMI